MRNRLSFFIKTVCLAVLTLNVGWVALPSFAQSNSQTLTWNKAYEIKRKPKAKRRPVERKPLLTLEWRLVKRGSNGERITTNPLSTFYTGDQIGFVIRANQDGFLYVFNHGESSTGQMLTSPQMIFPITKIKNGRNDIQRDQEYVFPNDCHGPEFDDPNDCWFSINPTPGNEVFTVVFSRDLIADFLTSSREVDQREILETLKRKSGQMLIKTGRPRLVGDSLSNRDPYTFWITNSNTRDNEEIIESFVIRHEAQ